MCSSDLLQMEFQALTIILFGGVAFAGGRGRILGVVTAWVFLGVLENGLTLLNVPPFIQLVASGLALVFAASIDAIGTYVAPKIAQRKLVAEQLDVNRKDISNAPLKKQRRSALMATRLPALHWWKTGSRRSLHCDEA